jgi:hypothetical protein
MHGKFFKKKVSKCRVTVTFGAFALLPLKIPLVQLSQKSYDSRIVCVGHKICTLFFTTLLFERIFRFHYTYLATCTQGSRRHTFRFSGKVSVVPSLFQPKVECQYQIS